MLIKGGTIVTSEKTFVSDILIENGIISQIGESLTLPQNTRTIDAEGNYVFPGGIDPHVHMALPTPAGPSADDFLTGSIAALYGGTTTLLDFVTPRKGQSLVEALDLRIQEAAKSLTHYSFHVSPVEWRPTTEEEITACFSKGITSFKVYMAYKRAVGLNDDDFYKVLQTVGRLGGMVTVHCELGDEIDVLRDQFVQEGKVSPEFHMKSRPPQLESEAVQRAIHLAEKAKCSLYIVHVSAKASLDNIRNARQQCNTVFAETCPHYLLLDDSKYFGSFQETVPYVISPPLRKKEDNEALWQAIAKGLVQTLGTDHCPFNLSQKSVGINDFRRIPNGAGGVEHRLSLLYTYGVLTEKISLKKLVDVFSTQPARLFGLFPAKGHIAVGADADLVIWNPRSEQVITAANHHQHCDLEIYEGVSTKGHAEFVIVNGLVVLENGKVKEDAGLGTFLQRGK